MRLERRGAAEGWLDEETRARIEREADEEIEEAVRFARASPFPPAGLTAELVYAP